MAEEQTYVIVGIPYFFTDGIAPAQELIRSRQPVDPDRLADASVPLLELVHA